MPNQPGQAAVVLTSIAAPNDVMKQIAADSKTQGLQFFVIGDSKSPAVFELDGCDFYSVERQKQLSFQFAAICPLRHYARKNIGYLLAIEQKSPYILETDDDNFPGPEFYRPLDQHLSLPAFTETGWLNVYRYYSDDLIWPRGIPLNAVNTPVPDLAATPVMAVNCPIQQGLANDNPDVDAIYRLLLPLPVTFKPGTLRLALGRNAWCPFNSQNTVFFPEAYPLLYLPAYCSFRMTDIWRSFVAQRIGWENGWSILFREATVEQARNDHSLMKDFEDEISGYLNNEKIGSVLQALELKPGLEEIPANLMICYRALVDMGVVGAEEIPLLEAWLADLAGIAERA